MPIVGPLIIPLLRGGGDRTVCRGPDIRGIRYFLWSVLFSDRGKKNILLKRRHYSCYDSRTFDSPLRFAAVRVTGLTQNRYFRNRLRIWCTGYEPFRGIKLPARPIADIDSGCSCLNAFDFQYLRASSDSCRMKRARLDINFFRI